MLTSAKLIHHLKNYYWCLLNMNWFQNVPSFIAILHIVQKLQAGHFLTLLLQIKYTTRDNPNNKGLTFSPKNQLSQVGRKWILSINFKTQKTYRKWKKACVAVLLRFINVMTALLHKLAKFHYQTVSTSLVIQ